MNKIIRILFISAALFFTVIISFNIAFTKIHDKQLINKNIVVNRINNSINKIILESNETPEKIIADNRELWNRTYGKNAPESIIFISLSENNDSSFYSSGDEKFTVCSIYNKYGELSGFVEYKFKDTSFSLLRICVNIFLSAGFIIFASFLTYIYIKILIPFRNLSEYPEKLAHLRDIQKLPESKSRFFGKYIWGMNMLTDVLAASNQRIHVLEGEHQKLVTSIAHGVKTPVANIRLYTDAVRTGLYADSSSTLEIADKIDRNAEKIQTLAEELMSASNASLDGYDIEISTFYLNELADLIRSEYTDRMYLLHIPFEIECKGSPVMESDKYALYRAISQLLENALKYGNGEGIKIQMMKQDEGFSISVRNKGKLLPESEIPYIFRSYWRGSNAANINGNGIGLYVVSETAKSLGGSIYARRIEENSEMEFILFFEI